MISGWDEAVRAGTAEIVKAWPMLEDDPIYIDQLVKHALSGAAPLLVAAAETRGRKQAADEIAEHFFEVVAIYVHATIHRGQWNWELDAKSKTEFIRGLTDALTDDVRGYAAEQDTPP